MCNLLALFLNCSIQRLKILFLPGFVVLVSSVFTGCNRPYTHEQDLLSYVQNPDNGLVQQRIVNETHISVMLRPTDLLVAQEIRHAPELPYSIDSLRAMYSDKLYFVLSFSNKGNEIENQFLNDRNQYQKAVAYAAAGMQQDIAAVAGNDTVPLIGYIYPRMYGSTEKNDIMLVFERDRLLKPNAFRLLIKDRMFGLGIQEFVFHKEDIDKIPALKLN